LFICLASSTHVLFVHVPGLKHTRALCSCAWPQAHACSLFMCLALQGVVNTSDGKVVRAFHRFTLVDQTGGLFLDLLIPDPGLGRASIIHDSHLPRRRAQIRACPFPCPVLHLYGAICALCALAMCKPCHVVHCVQQSNCPHAHTHVMHMVGNVGIVQQKSTCCHACALVAPKLLVCQCTWRRVGAMLRAGQGRDLTKGRTRDAGAVKISCARQVGAASRCACC